MKKFLAGLIVVFTMALGASAQAAVVSFSPCPVLLDGPDSFAVDIVVSDLGSDLIGTFGFDITYDSAFVAFDAFTPSGELGDVSMGEAFDDSVGDNVTVTSLLFDFELDPLQDGDVTLGTLDFTAFGLSSGLISIDTDSAFSFLGDAQFPPQSIAFTVVPCVVSTVPVGLPIVLLASGICGLAVIRRK